MEMIETPKEFADRYWRSIPPRYSEMHKMLADQVIRGVYTGSGFRITRIVPKLIREAPHA